MASMTKEQLMAAVEAGKIPAETALQFMANGTVAEDAPEPATDDYRDAIVLGLDLFTNRKTGVKSYQIFLSVTGIDGMQAAFLPLTDTVCSGGDWEGETVAKRSRDILLAHGPDIFELDTDKRMAQFEKFIGSTLRVEVTLQPESKPDNPRYKISLTRVRPREGVNVNAAQSDEIATEFGKAA